MGSVSGHSLISNGARPPLVEEQTQVLRLRSPRKARQTSIRMTASLCCELLTIALVDVAVGVRKYLDIAARAPSYGQVDLNASLASSLARLEKPVAESGAVIESATAIPRDNAAVTTLH